MFHSTFDNAKTLTLAAALLVLPASSALAQGAYGVQSNTSTLGVPGSGHNNSNVLALETYVYREMDPAGGYWGTQANNTVWADGAAKGWSAQGEMHAYADAATDRLAATYLPNSYPYGAIETRYWDTVTVTSDSLPAGTPVTLTFRNKVTWELNASGLYGGSVNTAQTVAGRSAYTNFQFGYNVAEPSVADPIIVVPTTVGARFTMSARLNLTARAFYSANTASGQQSNGDVDADILLKMVLESATGDVEVVADSGVIYTVGGN